MATYVIEKDVPITKPLAMGRGGRRPLYPFRALAIGESFWAPKNQLNTHAWTQRTGRKYVTRAEFVNGVRGTRVWRIA